MADYISEFDFQNIGAALKHAREEKGLTREQLAEKINKAPRHIQAIENEGQMPSVRLLIHLVRMFDISLDQYIFPEKSAGKSTTRRQVDTTLDDLDDRELMIIEATAKSLLKAREPKN